MLKRLAIPLLFFFIAVPLFADVTDCTGHFDGEPCDDGNPCTVADQCASGECVGYPLVGDSLRVDRPAPGDPTGVISWTLSNPGGSDLVRGLVSALPVSPTDVGETLLVKNTSALTYQDFTIPPPGGCYWYLVRWRGSCGGGSWGYQTQNGVATTPRQPHESCVVNVHASPRYVDHGLTITDLATCLEWEKKGQPGESALHDVGNTYAQGYGQQWSINLNDEHFAGRTDWRLPTSAGCCGTPTGQAAELESIVDGTHHPTIDPIFGPTMASRYWTSSTRADIDFWGWTVNFDSGGAYSGPGTCPWYMRAVRGGP